MMTNEQLKGMIIILININVIYTETIFKVTNILVDAQGKVIVILNYI